MFQDEDGRVYFYWGCSSKKPIYGVEMDPETMHPVTEPIELIHSVPAENGFERPCEDHRWSTNPEIRPYLEGAWMTKYKDTYYVSNMQFLERSSIYMQMACISLKIL